MNKINRSGHAIVMAMLLSCVFVTAFAEEIIMDAPAEAAPAKEAAVSADVPASKQELMQQAADGDVAQLRVVNEVQPPVVNEAQPSDGKDIQPHNKFMKPNRMQMHASVTNQKSGFGFLEENQRKPGVVKLKSGLQYKVLKAGEGTKATEKDVVSCQYRGTLVDGTVFEQSAAGKPSSIKVAPLMPGLKEAIKLMPIGSKWQVYMPPELGFGSAGKLPKVGPDSVLIYDLELLAVNSSTVTQR